MKLIQVGSSGHFAYALPAAAEQNCSFSGIAMGDKTEENTCMGELAKAGFAPKQYSSFEELMQNTDADVLIINSYMGYNARFAIEALKKGISVYCEKPIATALPDLHAVMSALKLANTPERLTQTGRKRVCLCGMFGISDEPAFLAARKAVAEGAIGEVRLANGQKSYRLGKREPFYAHRNLYGGTIPWVSIHAIDWAWRLSGIHPCEVTARHSCIGNGGYGDLEASSYCLFSDATGASFGISADYLRPSAAPTHGDDRIRLAGTAGVLEVRYGKAVIIDKHGERELPLPPKPGDHFGDFLKEIETGKPGYVSAWDSFYSTYLALMARESADKKVTLSLDFEAFSG